MYSYYTMLSAAADCSDCSYYV